MNRMAQSWPPTEKTPDEMWSPLAMPLCRLYPEISNECEPCSVTGVQMDRLLVLIGVDMWSQASATTRTRRRSERDTTT